MVPRDVDGASDPVDGVQGVGEFSLSQGCGHLLVAEMVSAPPEGDPGLLKAPAGSVPGRGREALLPKPGLNKSRVGHAHGVVEDLLHHLVELAKGQKDPGDRHNDLRKRSRVVVVLGPWIREAAVAVRALHSQVEIAQRRIWSDVHGIRRRRCCGRR